MYDYLRKAAKQFPEKIAIKYKDVELSYCELDNAAKEIADKCFANIRRCNIGSYSISLQKIYREKIIYKLGKLKYDYVNKNRGEIITKLTSDIGDLGKFLSENLPDIIYSLVMIITFSVSIMIILST